MRVAVSKDREMLIGVVAICCVGLAGLGVAVGGFFPWLREQPPSVGQLFGSLIGFAAAIFAALYNAHLNRSRDAERDAEEARQLAAAILPEMIELLGWAEGIFTDLTHLGWPSKCNHTREEFFDLRERLRRLGLPEVKIWEGLAEKVGLLPPAPAQDITRFYIKYGAIKRLLENGSSANDDWLLIRHLHAIAKNGGMQCSRVSEFTGFPYESGEGKKELPLLPKKEDGPWGNSKEQLSSDPEAARPLADLEICPP